MATVNLKKYPFTLRAINRMLREHNGVAHKNITALEVPAKHAKRLATAERAATMLNGKPVADFMKKLPNYYPSDELRRNALQFFATADYDVLAKLARKVKGGNALHRVLDDAFEGEEGSIGEAIYKHGAH